ncbi:hypothetical protein KFK09_029120 [Dendrobium nobile]|uniref:BED-type domain-containing protein n=1 Tax=Dendrobium nobile TaxID=94219 RepID=A0A8T3A4C8_DENNO|nr:hypothetical protein KFK09_029120 [Dendrobium nobile]
MEDSNTIVSSNPSDHNEYVPTDNEHEYDSDELNNASGTAQKKKRRLTTNVWGHFEMLPLAKDGKQRCKCKKCGATYLSDSKNSTGNLRRHLQILRKETLKIYVNLFFKVTQLHLYLWLKISLIIKNFTAYLLHV